MVENNLILYLTQNMPNSNLNKHEEGHVPMHGTEKDWLVAPHSSPLLVCNKRGGGNGRE